MLKSFLPAALVGALALAAGASSLAPQPAVAAEAAQDFMLRNVDGKPVKLSDYKGKVVLLQFWATWCGPCKVEMEHLQPMYEQLNGQGFEVLSISSDDARTSSQVKPFVKRKKYDFTVLLDRDATVTGTYNPTKTLPYSVLIDRQGQVYKQYSGYNPGDEKTLEKDVKELLANK